MNDTTAGRLIRVLRRRKGWRQQDLADEVGVSQGLISLVERGHIDRVSLRTLRAILARLDATLALDVRRDGGIVDRLLDEGHAALAGTVANQLAGWNWEVVPEVSYSEYGERGSIDLLAWQAPSQTLLVVEIKTQLVSVEETLRKHDEKVRLSPKVAAERFGWRAAAVGGVVVLPSDRTQRRRVDRHAAILSLALPDRGHAVRAWLQRPAGRLAGVWFVTGTTDRATGRGVDSGRRVRKRSSEAA